MRKGKEMEVLLNLHEEKQVSGSTEEGFLAALAQLLL